MDFLFITFIDLSSVLWIILKLRVNLKSNSACTLCTVATHRWNSREERESSDMKLLRLIASGYRISLGM